MRHGAPQIERAVRQVCRALFLPPHCPTKEERKLHVAALKRLGELYHAAAKSHRTRAAPTLTDIEEMLLKSHDYAHHKAASEEERSRAEAEAQAQAFEAAAAQAAAQATATTTTTTTAPVHAPPPTEDEDNKTNFDALD
jgi:hypothetical protein